MRTCRIRSGSQRTWGRESAGRSRWREMPFSWQAGWKASYKSIKRVSISVSFLCRLQVLASAEARRSISSMRRDIRTHSLSMRGRSVSFFCGESDMAAAAERRTARGERSSWEAAAMNRACFCLLSSTGFKDHPTNTQLMSHRQRIPDTASRDRYRTVFFRASHTGGM